MDAVSEEKVPPFPGKSWVGPGDVLQALRALRVVAGDPNRTDKIGEFIASLTGPSANELFEKVWRDPVGRRLLEEGRDLRATLSDRAYLASLPEGSLGRTYHDWTASRSFTAEGLAEAIAGQVPRDFEGPGPTFAARIVDMHDLWHVVNGWDSDVYGEMHLLGYSYAQLGAWSWLLLAMLANLFLVAAGRFEGIGYLRDAIRRGSGAALLPAVEWEAMLPLPLEEVRRRLAIEPPAPYEKLFMNEELDRVRRANPVYRILRAVLPR